MPDQTNTNRPLPPHVDVLIVGAGISGIDAAQHLQTRRPETSFAIVEKMAGMGGTWRTHTFPGIRSDSDLYTFGFKWKPWTGVPVATADEILAYLGEALDEQYLRRHIRFGLSVEHAAWDSRQQHWRLTLRRQPGGAERKITCGFLWLCAGYYHHDHGYTPDWPGMDDFAGPIVHPQTWPEDLDCLGQQVVVIGSGASAATLIPSLAGKAAHVTMLQRSPTYYYPRPRIDEFAETLKALDLPDEWIHQIMRRKFLHEQRDTVRRSFEEPQALAAELINGARAYLGADYDIATHFTPTYRPWRQRIAMVPDGDLFQAIRAGHAEVVTDRIERFTETGLALASGRNLSADIIVTATGLRLNALGDITFEIDGEPLAPSQCWTHRGIMFTGLPNLATVFGYLRTSWTMRAGLVSDYICRLLDHMAARGAGSVVPQLRAGEHDMPARPWIDPDNFNAGYITRALDILPRQGDRQPWLMTQDYYSDRETLPAADLDDGTLIWR